MSIESNANEVLKVLKHDFIEKMTKEVDNYHKSFLEEFELLKIENNDLKKEIIELKEQNESFMSVSLIVATKNENQRLLNELNLLNKRLQYYEKKTQQYTPELKRNVETSEMDTSYNFDKHLLEETAHEVTVTYKHNLSDNCTQVNDISSQKNDENENRDEYSPNNSIAKQECQECEEEDCEEEEDEEEVNVIEKKIEGKMYYVSDDDNMIIYEKLPNEEIGDEIGQLVEMKTKSKIKYKAKWNT